MSPKHIHNMSKTKTFKTWDCMIQRCTNPKNTNYHKYGGRGISVCEEWKTFSNFLKDMGERPKNKTLDRINNNLGYYKKNCRWATTKEQGMNKRTTRKYYMNGLLLTAKDLSVLGNTKIRNIYYRSKAKMPLYKICGAHIGGL